MINNSIRQTVIKHQRAIMLTVAIVALAAYIVPFGHLYDVADAQKKSLKSTYSKKKDPSLSVKFAQTAVNDASSLLNIGSTLTSFQHASNQVCSGFATNCPSTQSIQFTPYSNTG